MRVAWNPLMTPSAASMVMGLAVRMESKLELLRTLCKASCTIIKKSALTDWCLVLAAAATPTAAAAGAAAGGASAAGAFGDAAAFAGAFTSPFPFFGAIPGELDWWQPSPTNPLACSTVCQETMPEHAWSASDNALDMYSQAEHASDSVWFQSDNHSDTPSQ